MTTQQLDDLKEMSVNKIIRINNLIEEYTTDIKRVEILSQKVADGTTYEVALQDADNEIAIMVQSLQNKKLLLEKIVETK